jgi:flagellar biosynthesis protein FlhA
MPTFLLDLLLTLNISIAVVIFVLATYLKRPLDFSTFPSVLLIVTLFRLALNISSTRLILIQGDQGFGAAGQVIAAFGNFVVGGNYAVGIVIFLILVLINFIVITKGSGRIAEVSARFTLDSMPGKQMAIDADLNAGLIDEREALVRRQEVSREADFYGTMDGASKFVRGDAVAGLIITAINILGGLVIGVLQKGLGIGEAAEIYTTLTIGDGLVSQMPALVVSTAAGMLVSRAGDQSELGEMLPRQVAQRPAALGVAGGVVFTMALVPGLPFVPFSILGATLLALAAYSTRLLKEAKEEKVKAVEEAATAAAAPEMEGPEEVSSLLQVDSLELEVGYGLLFLVDPDQGGDLLDRIRSIRRQTALEMGIVVPPVRIRDNLQLLPTEYMVLIKGVEVARSELKEGHFLAMNPGLAETGVDGIPTREPAFGLDALWIHEKDREEAQVKGYTVVDLSTVVATHITEIIKSNAFELLGRQETSNLLDMMRETSPALVEELVPGLLPLGVIQKVLQNLLRERVSIRDLGSILEALADSAMRTKDPELLTEYARWALRRSISRSFQDEEGQIPVIALSSELEQMLAESVMQTDQGSYISLAPPEAHKVIQLLSDAAEEASMQNYLPLVLAPSSIRMPLRKLSERTLPTLMVMSHNEVDGPVRTLKVVGLES